MRAINEKRAFKELKRALFFNLRHKRANVRLCPNNYLSAPGLSWDTMLKMTKIEL